MTQDFTTATQQLPFEKLKELSTILHSRINLYMGDKDQTPHAIYYQKHIALTAAYADMIAERFGDLITSDQREKLKYVAYAHDLMKYTDTLDKDIIFEDKIIPHNYFEYLDYNRSDVDSLLHNIFSKSDLSGVYSCIGHHGCAAALILHKGFNIIDDEILYPIMFHGGMIDSVYICLPDTVKMMVDIIILADKLSSSSIKINDMNMPCKADMDVVVFGLSGYEFNFSIGILVALLLGGHSPTRSIFDKGMFKYYIDKARDQNPLLSKTIKIRKLGGKRIWPKRNSRTWQKALESLKK